MRPVEQALLEQAGLHLLKGHRQISRPLRRQPDAVELILAVPWEHRHPARRNDLHPVLRVEAQGGGVPPEHDTPQCPLPVLQGEVVVSRGIHFIVGQFPTHQQAGQDPVPIHETLDILAHLAGGEDCLLLTGGAHRPASRSRARQVRMAVPMALSAAY